FSVGRQRMWCRSCRIPMWDSAGDGAAQKERRATMQRITRQRMLLTAVLTAGLGVSSGVRADGQKHVRGVITDRGNEGSLMLQTDDSSSLTVVVDDSTKVRRSGKRLSSAVLTPGLYISAKGTYESPSTFVARRISLTKPDLKMARAIQGGLSPTEQRVTANQRRIEENTRRISQQDQLLRQQGQQIGANKEQIAANDLKIVATTGALSARISNLDDYAVIQSMTVYFANGKANIASKYKTQLQQFAAQAKESRSYAIQVQGFASAVGPEAFNQQLSMKRADAVTGVLQQSGVPLTNVIVPAAMGISQQVASNKTAKGQAEN